MRLTREFLCGEALYWIFWRTELCPRRLLYWTLLTSRILKKPPWSGFRVVFLSAVHYVGIGIIADNILQLVSQVHPKKEHLLFPFALDCYCHNRKAYQKHFSLKKIIRENLLHYGILLSRYGDSAIAKHQQLVSFQPHWIIKINYICAVRHIEIFVLT